MWPVADVGKKQGFFSVYCNFLFSWRNVFTMAAFQGSGPGGVSAVPLGAGGYITPGIWQNEPARCHQSFMKTLSHISVSHIFRRNMWPSSQTLLPYKVHFHQHSGEWTWSFYDLVPSEVQKKKDRDFSITGGLQKIRLLVMMQTGNQELCSEGPRWVTGMTGIWNDPAPAPSQVQWCCSLPGIWGMLTP